MSTQSFPSSDCPLNYRLAAAGKTESKSSLLIKSGKLPALDLQGAVPTLPKAYFEAESPRKRSPRQMSKVIVTSSPRHENSEDME